jgi:hypothetical protein
MRVDVGEIGEPGVDPAKVTRSASGGFVRQFAMIAVSAITANHSTRR